MACPKSSSRLVSSTDMDSFTSFYLVCREEWDIPGSLALCPCKPQERKPPAWHRLLVSSRTPQMPLIKAHTGTTINWAPERPQPPELQPFSLYNYFHEELSKEPDHFLPSLPGLSIFGETWQPTIQEQCTSTPQMPGSLFAHAHAF